MSIKLALEKKFKEQYLSGNDDADIFAQSFKDVEEGSIEYWVNFFRERNAELIP